MNKINSDDKFWDEKGKVVVNVMFLRFGYICYCWFDCLEWSIIFFV